MLGIDTGQRCGFALLSAPDWSSEPVVTHLGYVDASSRPDHISQVRIVGDALREMLHVANPYAVALEAPVPAGTRGIGAKLLQARIFQHLIDASGPLYFRAFSEVAPARSRAQVLVSGDYGAGRTKRNVVARVDERFGLGLRLLDNRVSEALADAVSVALAFLAAVRGLEAEGGRRGGPGRTAP